jgi:mannose-6-phosphate isomerase-like protein (cupin superfamily)
VFETKRLPRDPDVVAPDGSDVRVLLRVAGGSMAHFELAPRATSAAVVHRTVEEVWFFLRGTGEMWRRLGEEEAVVEVGPNLCVSIPVGTEFQLRSRGEEPLTAIALTAPPWPGPGEATLVEGRWPPTVQPGPT